MLVEGRVRGGGILKMSRIFACLIGEELRAVMSQYVRSFPAVEEPQEHQQDIRDQRRRIFQVREGCCSRSAEENPQDDKDVYLSDW